LFRMSAHESDSKPAPAKPASAAPGWIENIPGAFLIPEA
jgi:hypothetical protein